MAVRAAAACAGGTRLGAVVGRRRKLKRLGDACGPQQPRHIICLEGGRTHLDHPPGRLGSGRGQRRPGSLVGGCYDEDARGRPACRPTATAAARTPPRPRRRHRRPRSCGPSSAFLHSSSTRRHGSCPPRRGTGSGWPARNKVNPRTSAALGVAHAGAGLPPEQQVALVLLPGPGVAKGVLQCGDDLPQRVRLVVSQVWGSGVSRLCGSGGALPSSSSLSVSLCSRRRAPAPGGGGRARARLARGPTVGSALSLTAWRVKPWPWSGGLLGPPRRQWMA